MKRQGNRSNVTNLSNRKSRAQYEEEMQALGINGEFFPPDAKEIVDPVYFYLFDPLLSRNCYLTAVEMDELKRMSTKTLPRLSIPEAEFHHKAQTFAIDLLLLGAPTKEIQNAVIHRNILSYLMHPHGQELIDSKPLKSGTYHAGSMFYLNRLEDDFIDATGRPISGTSEHPMNADQLAQYCLPYIVSDLERHPDYMDRYPIRPFLTNSQS